MTIKLTGIHIYPIKALGSIALDEAMCTSRGLRNDRRFLVVDDDHEFITQREIPKMATVWVDLDGEALTLSAPDLEPVSFAAEPRAQPLRTVRVWSSTVSAHTVSPDADRWLSDYLGVNAHLVYMPDGSERRCNPDFARNGEIVSFADGFPFLIATEESLADLNARIVKNGGSPLPMNRFRPNLVVKGAPAFAEDAWGEFQIGKAIFRAAKPCARCQVTTTDQASGEVRGPEPLATLSTYRNTDKGMLFGMNLVPVKLGTIRVGDTLQHL